MSPGLSSIMCMLSLAVLGLGCSKPTQPSRPHEDNTPPTIVSVLVSTSQVEAGQDVEATVTAGDAETPTESLRYTWTADAGTFLGQGSTIRWRSPTDGPVPGDYPLRVTVSDAGQLTANGMSTPIRVNDAIREMRQLALLFLSDFADTSKSPTYVVRNFTDSCRGKADELSDIQSNRNEFDQIVAVHEPVITVIQRNSSSPICSYPASLGGPEACTLLIAAVDWRSRFSITNTEGKAPGTWEHVVGDAWLTGVYERRQWWLCDSRCPTCMTLSSLRKPFLR